MSAPGENAERFPLTAGLVTTAAGLILFWGTSLGLARMTGIALAGVGAIMVLAELARRGAAPADSSGAPVARPPSPSARPAEAQASEDDPGPLQQRNAGATPASDALPPPTRGGEWLTLCVREWVNSFEAWFEQREIAQEPWSSFDRWVRDILHHSLGARRVRCFHAVQGSHRLVSLTDELEEPLWPPGGLPGLIEHVLATGRAYVHASGSDSESIERLAEEWKVKDLSHFVAPHWLLPVREANRTVGLALVGELPEPARRDSSGLAALGGLVATFWRHVRQADALAVAERTDRTSGLLTRADLTARARAVLVESARESEPVVVLALAAEGLRRLDEQGHWSLRDQLMRQIGEQMQIKLRSGDLVGRFSEDRFVAVLRRLDPALGQIIARKLLATVGPILSEQPVLEETVRIRCGLSDAGEDGFEAAVSRAFEALRQARAEGRESPLVVPAAGRPEMAVSGGAL